MASEQAVRVERAGPVTTGLLSRPARRNAVDGVVLLGMCVHAQVVLTGR